jgi:NAD(P)-dependent dehydrogenase (short-subunit alcohol dehydrogenase family)
MSGSALRLQGKTAVVTGGASGIGRAIAEAFLREGAAVHILDIDGDAAHAAAHAIGGPAGSAIAHTVDVADSGAVARVFDAILAAGPVDILVNNAGIAHIGTVEDTTPADLDRLYAVNVRGMYNCMHAVVGAMKARGQGVILNMASVAASSGIAQRFAYSMTKGAVRAMTYSVAKDYVAHGIRCVSISPARIHTPLVDGYLAKHYPGREPEMFRKLAATQPIGRMGLPREVADLAVYLCSDEAAFLTGTDVPIDGGFLRLNS